MDVRKNNIFIMDLDGSTTPIFQSVGFVWHSCLEDTS